MVAPLKFLTIPAAAKHTATVIFAHGLGDTGYGWKAVADMFKGDPSLRHIKWILPHAPTIPITANMGMQMPGWFDIYSFGFKGVEDEDGMLKTVSTLQTLIKNEIEENHITPDRIVLGGFSQGGAMSLLTGLTMKDYKLGGLVALSAWLPIHQKFESMLSPHAKSLPIFVGHGQDDPLIKLELSTMSMKALQSFGFTMRENSAESAPGISYRTYPELVHSSSLEELVDLKGWLAKTVPATSDSGST